MAFPITHIKATGVELTDELRTLLAQKLEPFEKFLGDESAVKCDIELEKTTNQQSGEIYRAEINLYRSGKLFRAEATTDQIEKSIDAIRDDLQKELRRSHDKKHSLIKRGGMRLKRMIRFGR